VEARTSPKVTSSAPPAPAPPPPPGVPQPRRSAPRPSASEPSSSVGQAPSSLGIAVEVGSSITAAPEGDGPVSFGEPPRPPSFGFEDEGSGIMPDLHDEEVPPLPKFSSVPELSPAKLPATPAPPSPRSGPPPPGKAVRAEDLAAIAAASTAEGNQRKSMMVGLAIFGVVVLVVIIFLRGMP
ncbi:MAG: hypothetical protein AAGA56_20030, partial [Myxococcota bacterium]